MSDIPPLTQKQTLGSNPFNLLLSFDQFKLLQKLLPLNISLVSSTKPKSSTRQAVSVREISRDSPEGSLSAIRPKRRAYLEAEQTIKGQTDIIKRCERVLNLVKRYKYSGPFLVPVDPVALNIPDYLDIIKEPMDLSTVERKLKEGEYPTKESFESDMRLIWSNASTYNHP